MLKKIKLSFINNSLGLYISFFITFLVLIACWSIGTPLMSSPDEAVNVTKAVAVDRGQLTGQKYKSNSNPNEIVNVPASFANLGQLTSCYALKPTKTATCSPGFKSSNKPTQAIIYVARYQPLYYSLVGLPSLLINSRLVFYLMRLTSAVISALMLTFAVYVIIKWAKSKIMLIGLLLAISPSIQFFAGMVNPISLEATAAICLWTSLLVLIMYQASQPPKGLLAIVVCSASIEALSRSISPFWVVLTVAICLLLKNKSTLRDLFANTRIRLSLIISSFFILLASTWIIVFHSTDVSSDGYPISKTASLMSIFIEFMKRTALYIKEAISFFGFLNVPSPIIVYIFWFLMIVALVILALYLGNTKQKIALIALIGATIFIPAIISTSQAHRLGLVWQGSDSFPIYVGLPILASLIVAKSTQKLVFFKNYLSIIMISLAGLLNFIAFYGELRRYSVGVNGPILFILNAKWQPPLGVITLTTAYLLINLILIYLITKAIKFKIFKNKTSY